MLHENQFEATLKSRRFEPPSVGFVERIIASAEEKNVVLGGLLNALKDSVVWVMLQKRPAVVFACAVLLGAFIGLNLPAMPTQEMASIADEETL